MSRVIRGGAPPDEPTTQPDVAPRVVPGEVFDARAEADRLVAAAREEAATIVRAAEADAARLRAEAVAEGRAAGRAEAAVLLAAAQAAEAGRVEGARDAVARLGLVAAEKLTRAAVTAEPARIAAIVEDVLSRARRATEVVVRVSADDVPELEHVKDRLRERTGVAAPLVVRADPSLARGDCIVETDLGRLDARVEVQIAALARALGIAE